MKKIDDKVSITGHLGELRKRIVLSLIAVVISFGICFYFSEHIFQLLIMPLKGTLAFSMKAPFITIKNTGNPDHGLVFLAPAEALWMHLKISLISSLVISSPIIFYEVWKFVAPGLFTKEKKYALPFVIVTSLLFLAGALFCFIIVLPFAINFLLTYKTETIKPMLSVGRYIDFCLKFIISFGAVFELPVILVFLTKSGIVTTSFLAKNRKYAILLAFVVAALLTPTPDAFNQTIMALPIIVLYEAGIWASKILNRKQKDKPEPPV
jgi:sec-independent protein translocase protein TatC